MGVAIDSIIFQFIIICFLVPCLMYPPEGNESQGRTTLMDETMSVCSQVLLDSSEDNF